MQRRNRVLNHTIRYTEVKSCPVSNVTALVIKILSTPGAISHPIKTICYYLWYYHPVESHSTSAGKNAIKELFRT